jgi:hypothetical protein
MILASGKIWEIVVKRKSLTQENLKALAAWALQTYFGEKSRGQRWFCEGLTEETVLNEFTKSCSPISPVHLVELWKAIPGIQKGLRAIDAEKDIDMVAAYLGRDKSEPQIPNYNKGDATLHEMSAELGTITATMVNKIFTGGAEKLRTLTGGASPEDLEDDVLTEIMEKIDRSRALAADIFAKSLLAHAGNIPAFLDSELKVHHLTRTEREAVGEDEIQCLLALSELTHEEIVRALLVDIEEDENLFKTFQNAASKLIHPRRSGRPKGSVKRAEAHEDEGEDSQEEEAVEQIEVLDVQGPDGGWVDSAPFLDAV